MWEQIAIGEFLNWRILFGDLVEVPRFMQHGLWVFCRRWLQND
jgi:hypothetical protein